MVEAIVPVIDSRKMWAPGRRPKITGTINVDLARLPLSYEFLVQFTYVSKPVDPYVQAARALIRILERLCHGV